MVIKNNIDLFKAQIEGRSQERIWELQEEANRIGSEWKANLDILTAVKEALAVKKANNEDLPSFYNSLTEQYKARVTVFKTLEKELQDRAKA